MDREKVIRHIVAEISIARTCKKDFASVDIDMLSDALELLQDQELVKPVNIRWELGINCGNCPKCMNWVQRTYNYCPFCGKAVKWNDKE